MNAYDKMREDLSEWMSPEQLQNFEEAYAHRQQERAVNHLEMNHDDNVYEPTIPSGFISLAQAKATGIWKEQYADLLEDKCSCGSDIIVTPNLTTIRCSNLRCKHTLASSILKFAKDNSLSGIGVEKALSLVLELGYASILDFFAHPPFEYAGQLKTILSDDRDFASCVNMLELPTVDTQAFKIFRGINSYEEYVAAVEGAGGLISFLTKRLGGEGKQATNVAHILIAYDYELRHIAEYANVIKSAGKTVKVAMTGNIKTVLPIIGINSMSKQEYLKMVNKMAIGSYRFEKTESVDLATYVIADYPSSSAKYLAGAKKNKIIDSLHFVARLVNGDIEQDLALDLSEIIEFFNRD